MKENIFTNNCMKALQWSMYDAVKNGELVRDIPARLIYVADSTERDALENVEAGTFAATYGLGSIWQRTGSGTWVDCLAEDSADET